MKSGANPMTIGLALMSAGFAILMAIPTLGPVIVRAL